MNRSRIFLWAVKSLRCCAAVLSAFIMALLPQGCSITHNVIMRDAGPPDPKLAAFNSELSGREWLIQTGDGNSFHAVIVRLGNDSTIFLDPKTGLRNALPTSGVRSISTRNHGFGAVSGAFVGGVTGGSAMGLALLTSKKSGGAETQGWAEVLVILGAIAGGVVGLTVGAIAGSSESYRPVPVQSK